jgi:hypothetical protein
LRKPDEWGSFDYQLALKLLKEKGLPVSEEQKQSLKDERIKALEQAEGEPASNILGYYIVSILFFPVWICDRVDLGIFKKTLPNGRIIPVYNNEVKNMEEHFYNSILYFGALCFTSILPDILEASKLY